MAKDFFNYLNKKIIYQFVFDNIKSSFDKIRIDNPSFNMESQFYLNHFRSFDSIVDKHKCVVDHILPKINIWAYNFMRTDCAVSGGDLKKFRELLAINAEESPVKICEFLAKKITQEIFDNDNEKKYFLKL